MRKFGGSEVAVSPVIGVVMLTGLTVIMVATIAVSMASVSDFAPEMVPEARIMAVEVKGGLPPSVSFPDNIIRLKHKGGDRLDIKKTKIILYGKGRSYRPIFGEGYVPAYPNVGDVQVFYLNLTRYGKISDYNVTNSPVLLDGFWSPGETLLLSGEDSLNSNDDKSSVWVMVNGDGETSNNYGFKAGEKVYITIIDTVSSQIISAASAIVQQA